MRGTLRFTNFVVSPSARVCVYVHVYVYVWS